MFLAGLDIGTTGCKVTVYDEKGTYYDRFYRDYPAVRTYSEHEIDAAAIWTAVKNVLRKAANKYPEIGGVGVTSFGETFVLLDENNEPLCPAMLYTDPRGAEECEELVQRLGGDRLTQITGLKPHPMYSMPKLMWIKKHSPELYSRVRHVFLIEDYIVYMLTGKNQIDYSLATRTMAFDIHALQWSTDVFEAADVDPAVFSKPVPTGTSAGTIKPDLATELGMPHDAIAVSVSHDQVAAAIGSGVFDENCAVNGSGTVECITPIFEHADAKTMADNNYAVVPYIIPGKYVCYSFSYTGGAIVKWFADTLAGYAAADAKAHDRTIYAELEDNWNNQPTGLLVLPHFAGAATPYMDAGSKGAIVGLTVANTQKDIHLAIMEGICYEMLLNIERLREAGIAIRQLRATGGGANSRVWLQMKADILNMPVTALRSTEAGAAGSAMLVGIALGVFRDLREAASVVVSLQETYLPRPDVQQKYQSCFKRYKKLYNAVRPLV